MTEFEGDLLAVFRYLPGFGQFGFQFLCATVDADQHSTGQIANGQRGLVIDEQRVEGLGLGAQAKAQFVPALGKDEIGRESQGEQSKAKKKTKEDARLESTTDDQAVTSFQK